MRHSYKEIQYIVLKKFEVELSDKIAKKLQRLASKLQRCREVDCSGFYSYHDYQNLKRFYSDETINQMVVEFENKWEKIGDRTYDNIKKLFESDPELTQFEYSLGSGDPRGSALMIRFKQDFRKVCKYNYTPDEFITLF